jgi:hypothetical protein
MTRDHVDDAIDSVAARLTEAKEDAAFALRIVNALPERSTWMWFGWKPRLALVALALVATIGVVQRTFDNRSTDVLRAENASGPVVELRASIEPLEPNRTKPLEPVEPMEPLEPLAKPDHEFSLPSIAAVAALQLELIAPATLPEDAALTIESLTIVDLPLSADPISPR